MNVYLLSREGDKAHVILEVYIVSMHNWLNLPFSYRVVNMGTFQIWNISNMENYLKIPTLLEPVSLCDHKQACSRNETKLELQWSY